MESDDRLPSTGNRTSTDHREEVFFVNDEPIVVRTDRLTVREILDDAGLSPADHVLFAHRDGAEVAIGALETPVILRQGMRFTARRVSWNVWVNGDEVIVNGDVLTFDRIVGYAKGLPAPQPGVEYTVGFEKAVHPRAGTLIAGESVRIKNGTQFEVSATNRS